MKIVFNNSQKMNEIIFAKRNKDYGAYALRTEYNKTLLKSLCIVFSTVLLFMIGTYIFTKVVEEDKSIYLGTNDTVIACNFKPLDEKKPDPPKQPQGGKKTSGVATSIVDTTTVENKPELDPNANLNPNGNANNTATLTGSGEGTVAVVTPTVEEVSEPPTAIPVENPEFEGGLAALGEFIRRNIVYPELAKEMGKEGTVYVSFIIDEKGQVESSKILKGIGAGCDQEAARVVNKLPKFKKPGRNALGKPVKVIFNIPIAFKLR
jgi:protein TonB